MINSTHMPNSEENRASPIQRTNDPLAKPPDPAKRSTIANIGEADGLDSREELMLISVGSCDTTSTGIPRQGCISRNITAEQISGNGQPIQAQQCTHRAPFITPSGDQKPSYAFFQVVLNGRSKAMMLHVQLAASN